MKTGDPLSVFRRVSVADQAANALREAIHQRALCDPLPGEHHLARHLGISRLSLRSAMAQLAGEGLIVRSNGRRARLRLTELRRSATVPPTVCVVCPMARKAILPNELILQLHAACAAKGMLWEEAFDPRLDVPHPERRLRALVSGRKHICWILLACSAPIQRWFARAGVPTFILGSCLPGVALPSIDYDFHAIGWHAAGTIIKDHHQHIALLQSHRLLAGDLDTCKGFLSYVAKSAIHVSITRLFINSDSSNLRSKLDHLMNIVGELAIVRSALGRVAEKLRGEGQRKLATELQRLHRNFDRRLGEMQDGILEVLVPVGASAKPETRIPIERS